MLNYDLMKDALHPDKPRGYEALGKCVRDILDSLPENGSLQNVRARKRRNRADGRSNLKSV